MGHGLGRHTSFFLELAQNATNHIAAYTGACSLRVPECEFPWESIDYGFNKHSLSTTRRFHFSCALFEFAVGAPEHTEKIIEPRNQVVICLVPVLGVFV
jgi:hypothetical protein